MLWGDGNRLTPACDMETGSEGDDRFVVDESAKVSSAVIMSDYNAVQDVLETENITEVPADNPVQVRPVETDLGAAILRDCTRVALATCS